MTQPFKICPQCQQRAEVSAAVCSSCGRKYRTTAPPVDQTQVFSGSAMQQMRPTQQPMPPPLPPQPPPVAITPYQQGQQQAVAMAMMCPLCSTPDIQKVSAIIETGTVVTQSSGVSVGAGHVFGGGPNFGTVGVSRGTSVGQSALVKMLMPPTKPLPPTNTAVIAVAVLVGIGLLVGMPTFSFLFDNPSPLIIVPILITVGLIGGAFWLWQSGQRDLQYKMQIYRGDVALWEAALQNWNLLFCCGRCGCVFHIHTRRVASPQEMYSLLN